MGANLRELPFEVDIANLSGIAASPGRRELPCQFEQGTKGSPDKDAGRFGTVAVNNRRMGFPIQNRSPLAGTLVFTEIFTIHCATG